MPYPGAEVPKKGWLGCGGGGLLHARTTQASPGRPQVLLMSEKNTLQLPNYCLLMESVGVTVAFPGQG